MQVTVRDTVEAVTSFRRDGYLIVRGLYATDELDALREEAAAQIAVGADDRPDLHVRRGLSAEGDEVLFGIDAVVANSLVNDSALKALGHPGFLAIASAVLDSGDGMVCWSDALLWKGPGAGAAVPMHSAHGWKDESFAHENLVGAIYLDESTPENGCLKVVPGSHHLSASENQALLGQGFEAPGIIDVILEAGDVLFHSEWMVHGSRPTPSSGRPSRRILYFAIRRPSVFAPVGCSPFMRRKVAAGIRRMQLAVERRGDEPFGAREEPFALTLPADWHEDVATADESEALATGYFGDMAEA